MSDDMQRFADWVRTGQKLNNSSPVVGGYVFPEVIYTSKRGPLAAFLRWLGEVVGSARIQDMGYRISYPYREIIEAAQRTKR